MQNNGSSQEGLEHLHLSPKEVAQLQAMAISTLEQLALSNGASLGMGKSKGNVLITRSQNILAARHVRSLSIGQSIIKIEVDRVSHGIIAAVKGVLGIYDNPSSGNCNFEVAGTSIILRRLESRPPQPCSYYDPSTYNQCSEVAVDRCACHNKYFCSLHLEGHTPSVIQDFARLIVEAQKLAEMCQQKTQRDMEQAGITLREEDVLAFARERGFTGFWQAVFEEIHGQEVMKQALAAGLFSRTREPVHVLVLGEPASAKTLARDILLRNFTGFTSIGGNATRAGLVCNRSTGEPGVLAFSDGKTVLVDEFDKIDPVDLSYCLELLSNGRCDVHSARMHETIESHFTMLAFANPEGDIFSGNPQMDIGMRPTVMSRFALVVRVEAIGRTDMLSLFSRSLDAKGELKHLPQYYDQWLKLARSYDPELKVSPGSREHYLSAMVDIVERYINTPLRRDIRVKDYLRRVPEAIARAEFEPVQDRHLEAALQLFRTSLETWHS